MLSTKPLYISAAVLLSACISLPEVDTPQSPPDGLPDSGIPRSVTLTLTSPSETAYTNGSVSIQLKVQGDTPEQVQLLVDDQQLTSLQAPYTFTWDTTSTAEGTHRLTARAQIGDQTFSSEVREVVVDRTPPQVLSRTPTPGAQDIWVRQPIQATFSEPLKASTLTNASVKLTVGGAEVTTTSSLSTDGKTLTIAPSSHLRVPNDIELALTNSMTDLAGNALVLPAGAWTWSLPVSFSMGGLSAVPGDTNVEAPSLQLDSQGQPLLVWREQVSLDKGNIYVYRWTAGDWEAIGNAVNPAPTLTSSSSSFNLNQMLQVDSSNAPVVAWSEADGTEPGIHVKRWSNNAWVSMGGALNAYPQSGKALQSLSLQLDTKDRPFIAWEQSDKDNYDHIHIWKWTGQDWMDLGGALPIEQIEGQAFPSLILTPSNNPIIAWANYSADPSLNGIMVRRWTGTSWEQLGSALAAVPQPSTRPTTPSLILDSSGAPVVAWSENDGSNYNIYVSRWTGTVWQPLGEALSAYPGNTNAFSPRLARGASGNLFIMWCEQGGGGQLNRWTGSAWESLGGPSACASALTFTLDSSDTPFVSYPGLSEPSYIYSASTYRFNY